MRRFLHLLILTLVVLLALLPGWARPAAPAAWALLPAAAQADSIAALDPVQGVVQHQSADADPQDPTAWQTLTAPALVAEGDRIRTDRIGKAYLTFFEGVETEIGANTLVVVSTLVLDDLENENFDVSMDVLLGVTLTTIDVTLDADDRFEVHTPGATAVVRGTQWWTLVHQDGRAEFESVEGTFGIVPDPTPPPEGASPAAPSVDGVWDTWIEFAPGVTGHFGPDGAPLEELPAIQLPELPAIQPLSAACGDGICQADEPETCAVDCLAQLDLSACGNGICEVEANEDLVVCPADCSPFPGAACGNGTCDADESGITCAADCAASDYFDAPYAALCGDGQCGVTESSLTCPGDCASGSSANADLCVISGDAVNLRGGPGLEFPVVRWLSAGDELIATGISSDGAWYFAGAEEVWALTGVVNAVGPCAGLPVITLPEPTVPAPVQPVAPAGNTIRVTPTTVGTGQWGGCGSCAACGPYPSAECVQAPDGQCLWDPSTCRPDAPPPTGIPGPTLTFPGSVTCTTAQALDVYGTYSAGDGATIDDHSAYSPDTTIVVTGSVLMSPTQVKVQIYCAASVTATATVNVSVTDTLARTLNDSFIVYIN